MKKSIFSLLFISMVAVTGACGNSSSDAGPDTPAPKSTVFLVGDSTVCPFGEEGYYYSRYGYGTKIENYLNSSVTVNNLALSGRSSKSFLVEPEYTTLKNSIKKGDYLIIGFGHNDEKAEEERFTDPTGAITDPTSFKYYLYEKYIKVAQAVEATPILCTPIVRRNASGTFSNNDLHVTTSGSYVTAGGSTVVCPGGDYAQCIRDLGASLGVTVIDNTTMTKSLHETIFAASGATGTAKLQAWSNSSSIDNTHINMYGASYVAYLMANSIKSSSSTLKSFVLDPISAPTESMLVVNPLYVEPPYAPPTVKSTNWTTTDPWWGTVFGDIGGVSKIADGSFAITETASGVSMRSGTTVAAGKISSTADGMAMYFRQIPGNKDFTCTATATVNSITSNDQVSFGIMVRDSVWIDKYAAPTCSWVAAGPFKITKGAAAWSSFIRDTTASTQLIGTTVSSATVVPVATTVVNLKIVRVGNVYTVTYGTEAAVNYTLNLNAIDANYDYVGVYTVRQCQVDFSNIVLTVAP